MHFLRRPTFFTGSLNSIFNRYYAFGKGIVPFRKKNIFRGIAYIHTCLIQSKTYVFFSTFLTAVEFSFTMEYREYPKTCKAIGIIISILRILAISYSIYVLSIATTPSNHSYSYSTKLSWSTFRYEDAFRIDFLVFNINIGLTAVLLILDLLLLYGSFRQIHQFLTAWYSCVSVLLIYDIFNVIRLFGVPPPIFWAKIIIFPICLYFVFQTAKEWQRYKT